jgi:hypothetical protein
VLSEELRERIRAAVRAERGEAVGQDQELANEPGQRATTSGPRPTDAASSATSSVNGAIEPERTVLPVKSRRSTEPAAAEHTAEPAASGRTAEPAASGRTTTLVEPEQTVKPVQHVARRPAVKPEPTDVAPVNHKPVAAPRTDRSRRPREHEPVRRRFATPRVVGSALVVIAAVWLSVAVTRYVTSPSAGIHSPSAASARQEAAVRKQAATWVAQQVSHDAMVSCDRAMCAALAADGFPSRELLVLGSTPTYPVTSAVVVETAAVRGWFGTSLHAYAPADLATFGSGDAQVDVRIIWPAGAAAYHKALTADLAARRASEGKLLQVNVITLSPTARQQLIAGQVDSRLMLAIAALATREPIDIVQFGNIGPGGDADIPLRYADLAENDQAAHLAGPAYVQSMRADLGTGPAAYRPASTVAVMLPEGQLVLRIEFTAPSPLGLLSPPATH